MTDETIETTEPEADKAIRTYLALVNRPDQLVDQEAIHKAERALEEATDPLERLFARQKVRDLQVPDTDAITKAFVEHAKAWAEAKGITPDTFMAENVPENVLKDAGFSTQNLRALERTQPKPQRRQGRRRVSADTVRAHVPTTRDPFTVADVTNSAGTTAGTARKIVGQMIEEGLVEELGPDPDSTGPGRAPVLYRRKAKR